MWFALITSIFTVSILPFTGVHDFHVSNMEVTYRTATKSLEVTLHLFVDDVELALEAYTKDPLHLCTELETPEAGRFLEAYLREHLVFTVNGNKVAYDFLGKEPGEDILSMYCYLELKGIDRAESLGIMNSLLTEVYSDQKNIVNIGVDREKRQYILFDDRTQSKEVKL